MLSLMVRYFDELYSVWLECIEKYNSYYQILYIFEFIKYLCLPRNVFIVQMVIQISASNKMIIDFIIILLYRILLYTVVRVTANQCPFVLF